MINKTVIIVSPNNQNFYKTYLNYKNIDEEDDDILGICKDKIKEVAQCLFINGYVSVDLMTTPKVNEVKVFEINN